MSYNIGFEYVVTNKDTMTGRQNTPASPVPQLSNPFEQVEREQASSGVPTGPTNSSSFAQALMNAGGHAEQPGIDTNTQPDFERLRQEKLATEQQQHQRVQAAAIERHTVFHRLNEAETAEIEQLRLKLATMARSGQIGSHHPLLVESVKPVVNSHGLEGNKGHKNYFAHLEKVLRKQIELAKNSREWRAKASAKARQKKGAQGGLEGSKQEQQQAVHDILERQESAVSTTGA